MHLLNQIVNIFNFKVNDDGLLNVNTIKLKSLEISAVLPHILVLRISSY